jgi:hypothetical protein
MVISLARTTRRRGGKTSAGMGLTPRDKQVLLLTYHLRQLTRAQLQRALFAGLSPSVCAARLHRLQRNGFLLARPVPLERTGRPRHVYAIGPESVGLVADTLGIPAELVRRRQLADAKLSFSLYTHRTAGADFYLALRQEAARDGLGVQWLGDEEVALKRFTLTRADGRTLPIRPDGMLVLSTAAERSACLVEVQITSRPSVFAQKADAYLAYWQSGQYTEQTGFRTLRVLTITDTLARARHHATAAARVGGASLFWTTHRDAACTNPLGSVWWVAARPEPMALFSRGVAQ